MLALHGSDLCPIWTHCLSLFRIDFSGSCGFTLQSFLEQVPLLPQWFSSQYDINVFRFVLQNYVFGCFLNKLVVYWRCLLRYFWFFTLNFNNFLSRFHFFFSGFRLSTTSMSLGLSSLNYVFGWFLN